MSDAVRPATDLRRHDLKERESTTRELTVQLGEQLSKLVRDEIALAKAEVFASARRAMFGGVLLSVALAAGLAGWLALVAAVAAGIAVALPVWAAVLITGGAFVAIAGACAALAVKSLRNGTPPLRMTTESIRGELREITSSVRR